MRHAVLIATFLLAACNSSEKWENRQAELANELNPPEPAAEQVAATEPDANEVNEVSPAANDVNAVSPDTNETAPPPAG